MKFWGHFMPALLAGVAIALGEAVMLCAEAGVAGALISGVGILAVQAFNMSLFTVRAEDLLHSNRDFEKRLAKVFVAMLGNTVGAALVGYAFGFVSAFPIATLQLQSGGKDVFALLLRALFGGVLIYIAMHGYKRLSGGFSGCLIAVLSWAAMEICGFSFALADIFRFAATLKFSLEDTALCLLIMAGNVLGVLAAAGIHALRRDKNDVDRHHA